MARNGNVEPTPTARAGLPVAVIGAGPVGLATAANQLELPTSGVCDADLATSACG